MKRAIGVIGEGITEKYYIESLKGLSPFTVLPKALGKKASSLKELESVIKRSIVDGFDEVYCLIDMDSKRGGTTKIKYDALKTKYHNKFFGKKKDGIQCKVQFIETERCTELWFLYHFTQITREFTSYKELEQALQVYRPTYEKTDKYFRSIVDLHKNLIVNTPKGSLAKAREHGKNSLISKSRDNRKYTYTEMHLLFDALNIEDI